MLSRTTSLQRLALHETRHVAGGARRFTHEELRMLPNKEWLIANGHEELVEAMQTNPELFAHIPQEPEAEEEGELVE